LDITLFVAAKYLDHKERLEGSRPVVTLVAAECRVTKKFVCKIERELMENERVLAPKRSKSMSEEDFFVIYILYPQEPTWSLRSYVYWLFCCTGTILSESTVSRWFNHAFPVRGRLCVPNLVPYDKFRPGNIKKAWEYLEHISKISPVRLKYGNKKSLKGKAIFNKLARRDVLTGLVPQTKADPDLQNTYSIIGICGICTRS
jgi:hypothetical protein